MRLVVQLVDQYEEHEADIYELIVFHRWRLLTERILVTLRW